MTSVEIFFCVVCVFLSAYFSATEVALFSLSRFQLRLLKDRFRPAHRKIKHLLADPGGLLISILVSNEIVNITLASIVTGYIAREWDQGLQGLSGLLHKGVLLTPLPEWAKQMILGILMTTPLVLLFCEATPKAIGVRSNQLVAMLTATPMNWIYTASHPIRFFIKKILGSVVKVLGKDERRFHAAEGEPLIREEEFLYLVEEGQKEGAIHQSEVELIQNIFELDDRTVMDIYTPLSQTHTLVVHTSSASAIAAMRGANYSRIPVTDSSRRSVLGILYAKDLLSAKLDLHEAPLQVEGLMRKPLIISPSTRLNALFRMLKQHRTHMAVIVVGGPSGEALGVVTMADVLDAIFEDIFREKPLPASSQVGGA